MEAPVKRKWGVLSSSTGPEADPEMGTSAHLERVPEGRRRMGTGWEGGRASEGCGSAAYTVGNGG